jgi:cyclopropane fatty-acyl-phospholipid synthase-like methyltransferase
MDWNKTYSESKDYFGSDPDPVIPKFLAQLDRGNPVLDIGAGEGRNALFFAREGFVVHALDSSRVATTRLEKIAAEQQVEIAVWMGDFADYSAESRSYSTVLAMGMIPVLSRDEINLLASSIRNWTDLGGLVFVTAFTTADPSYHRYTQDLTPIDRHSFALPEGGVRTFLEPGEALALFHGFEVMYHWEGMGPEHRHGHGNVHRHGWVELVLRRIAEHSE